MSDIVVEDVEDLKVNPALWASVNDWLISANLTAVLAINDNDRVNGEWSPKSMLPMFDLTDKLNITCYFQLGYGQYMFNYLYMYTQDDYSCVGTFSI